MKNAVMDRGSLKKSAVNRTPPNVKEASPAGKAVKMAPKINAEAGGKRVILTEASPNKRTSTFRAPRSNGGGSLAEMGYTKLGK